MLFALERDQINVCRVVGTVVQADDDGMDKSL
jgi:hypothetical protein